MKIKLILAQLVVLLLISCTAPERNNPFDPECPKGLWSPTTFEAVQVVNTIKLTWSSPSVNFTGFRIYKSVGNGSTISLGEFPKNENQFIDTNIVGGQQHAYTILAYAGTNESNSLYAGSTPILQASVLTNPPTFVGTKTATFNGSITTNGGAQITERGFCWSLNANPTVLDNKVINLSGLNNFNEVIIGLNANTNYYVRAYAVNNQGVSYGNQQIFTTLGYGSVTDIDNNIYSTVTIGTQVWMVENLKTTKYKNGISIPNLTNSSWYSTQNGAYCYYNNDVANKNIYGALYNFYAVQTGNLAPTGWHVPSDSEWTILINYFGGPFVAGSKLKELGITHWTPPNTDATNIVGFTALPGGEKIVGVVDFYHIREWGYWWSSTTDGSTTAKYRAVAYNGVLQGQVINNGQGKNCGFSIRCVKD